jgi:hypothetical protein
VSHTRATDGLNESFLDDTVLNVKREFASALLGCAPSHTVGISRNVGDLLCHHPFALFGNGSGTVLGALGDHTHILYIRGINDRIVHFMYLL